ncbi:MAG: amino acid ABC transporter ATP-binding protein [Planctomycetota bacterium]
MPPSPTPAASGATLLQAEGLHKRFGSKEVLRGVDLAVGKGEVVAILGPNGCGKSTFLRCLNLLEPYHAGRVLLDGQPVSQGRPDDHRPTQAEERAAQALRRRMGMVFQRFNLFPHWSVLHNVAAGPLHALHRPRAEAYAVAEQMLRKVGLWEKHPCDPLTLSGGQQQRVAIARALAMQPEVMLFDEATSALDPMLTKEVFKVIRELAAEGMTMLLVTHDMAFARSIADRVVFMDEGRVEAEGSPEAIFDGQPTAAIRRFLEPG